MSKSMKAAVLVATLATAGSASAHHSGAMFDRAKTVSLTGVVKTYLYTNPHSWVTLLVPEAGGQAVSWDVEAFTPGAMQRWGVVPSTLKPGDKVTLRMHPLRDGRRGGSLVDITLANGRYVNTTPGAANEPAPAQPPG